ncbi:MAG: ribonuclease E/G [Rhodospirillales bacterium]
MENGLLLQALGGETRAFRFRDGDLVDLGVWRGRQPLPGDVYLGRVQRLEPALGLAFCDLGVGPAGVLPFDQAPKTLTEGLALPLRILRAAAPGKGPKLTAARGPTAWREGPAPRLLQAGSDRLARFLAPEPAEIQVDSADLARQFQARGLSAKLVPGGFSGSLANRLEAEVECLLRPRVDLPGGGSLLIEPGETLTAIDVNMGAGGRGGAAAAATAFNLQALPEIARQLRLRSLAGRILIDCLALASPAQRQGLRQAMGRALADDPETTRLRGLTESGLLELTRRRGLLAPLHELLTEPAGPFGGRRLTRRAAAAALIRRLSAQLRETPGAPLRLEVDPPLLVALDLLEDWQALRQAAGPSLRLETREAAPDDDGYRLATETRD